MLFSGRFSRTCLCRRDFFQFFCMFYLRLINRKCAKEKKHQYLMLYQNWNRTTVYFKLAVSASYVVAVLCIFLGPLFPLAVFRSFLHLTSHLSLKHNLKQVKWWSKFLKHIRNTYRLGCIPLIIFLVFPWKMPPKLEINEFFLT